MTIEPDDLHRPASLTLWPSEPDAPKAVEPHAYPTLQEALHEAGLAMRDDSATPWIITESGLILSPGWLRGHLDEVASRPGPTHPVPQAPSPMPALSGRTRATPAPRLPRVPPLAVLGRHRRPDATVRS